MQALKPLPQRPDDASAIRQGPRAAGAAVPREVRERRSGGGFGWPDRVALAILLLVPLLLTAWGWPYYSSGLAARLRSPLHALLKPSGVVGLGLGVTGFALFLFMWLYPWRKRLGATARWAGSLGVWIRVHAIAGMVIPVIVAVHAGWRFDGLIGLGYGAMLTVSLSGFIGRYLYTHIPRSRNGVELTLDDVRSERRALLTEIAVATGQDPLLVERRLALGDVAPRRGAWSALAGLVTADLARARTMRALGREWARPAPGRRALDARTRGRVLALARRELALRQQMSLLGTTQRLFGYWHVAHRPVAVTALLAVLIHVVVAVLVGGIGLPGAMTS